MIAPKVFEVLEETSDTYYATLVDSEGVVLPSNALSTCLLTLYVVKADGTLAYVNSRNLQDVLAGNDVTLYPALQTRFDGLTFNLKWAIQPADTTFVEDLSFERHIARFDYTWPQAGGGFNTGRHEVVINVQNLVGV